MDGQKPVPVQAQHLADQGDGHDKADGLRRAVFFQYVRPLPGRRRTAPVTNPNILHHMLPFFNRSILNVL